MPERDTRAADFARWPWVLLRVVGFALLAVLSVRARLVTQGLFVAICGMGIARLVRRKRGDTRLPECLISCWILSFLLPLDIAVRRGDSCAIRWARVVHDVAPERLMREHPGRTYITQPERLGIPVRAVVLIEVPSSPSRGDERPGIGPPRPL
jgi:hypothetical protein